MPGITTVFMLNNTQHYAGHIIGTVKNLIVLHFAEMIHTQIRE